MSDQPGTETPDWAAGPEGDRDRYRLVRLHARGAEGEVWQAVRRDDPTEIRAIKMFHTRPGTDPGEMLERLRQRVDAYGRTNHASLVRIHECFLTEVGHWPSGTDQPTVAVILVMDWVNGHGIDVLQGTVPKGDPLELLTSLMPLASALDQLHEQDPPFVHGDVKPQNILTDGRSVTLVDLGPGRTPEDEPDTVVGTPGYMAPEILKGGLPSPDADRFAFGVACRQLLTHETTGLSAHVESLLAEMTDPDPERRPRSARAWLGRLLAAVAAGTEGTPPRSTDLDEFDTKTPRSRGRRILLSVVTASLVLGGGAGALALANRTREPADPAAVTTSDQSEEATAEPSMPHVKGMQRATAERLLRKRGIADINIVEAESAEPAGMVLSQAPTPGERVDGEVTLTVATTPTSLPDFVGRPIFDATEELTDLGIEFETRDRLDEGATPGVVVEQEPPAGSPIPDKVILTVARRAVAVLLQDLNPVEGDLVHEGLQTVNGENYAHSVYHLLESGESRTTGYDMGRKFSMLRGVVGLGDTAPSDAKVKFEVFGDGISLFAAETGLGQVVPIDVSIEGVLRLRISTTVVSQLPCCPDVPAVFGDLRAVGAEGRVPTPTPSA